MGRTIPIVSNERLLSNEYVVGLTDGEGCFYINIWKSPAYRAGSAVQLHFHVKMQERDRELLEMVRNTIGCGEVYFQKEQRANHCQCYRYTVSSKKDILNTVIPFFKHYPLQSATKRSNFDLFCKAADLVKEGKHLTAEGISEIRVIKAGMNIKTMGLA